MHKSIRRPHPETRERHTQGGQSFPATRTQHRLHPKIHIFFFLFPPRRARGNPCPHLFSSFRVPVRTRFVSSTFVGPVCDLHESMVYSEDVGTWVYIFSLPTQVVWDLNPPKPLIVSPAWLSTRVTLPVWALVRSIGNPGMSPGCSLTTTRLRTIEGKSPWLAEGDGVDAAVKELTKFMALRCFAFKNQSQTIRGYLSAIKYFHRMFGGWELPTSHCMVVAVGKGIDRAHGKSEIRRKVRKPLTWDLLTTGTESACELGTEGWVV